MPNTTTGSKVIKTTTATKNSPKVNHPDKAVPAEKPSYKVKKSLSPNMIVTVKNGFNGTLVYRSKRTGEVFVWDSFGSEQEMELQDLTAAKNTYKSFFVNNWFLFDDPEVIEWLGLSQYYKNALNTDSFNSLFVQEPDEIKETVAGLSGGQKKSVIFRAKQMIQNGEIDSIKVINALEESLGVDLIER